MSITAFTLEDLMSLLTLKAGLPPAAHTTDPDATLEALGLDSLAFLALQTELQNRFGFELPYDRPAEGYALGDIAADIDERVRSAPSAEAS